MRKTLFFISFFICNFCAFGAEVPDLNSALRATYTACVGIDDELADLKKLAGINTAVTAVGTATGGAATVVGLVKASKDKQIEDRLPDVRESYGKTNYDKTVATNNYNAATKAYSGSTETEIDRLTKQSKNLGYWRTGLMAGATATNIAGAAIAGTSLKKGDIQGHIDDCMQKVSELRTSIAAARMNGEDVSEAQGIVKACSQYTGLDISKIQKQAKGSLVSSLVGTATGIAGTTTSAVANSDNTRKEGGQKEKNLNTASNVLAGATTAASATATVFNALQIGTIKKVASVASECEGVLK